MAYVSSLTLVAMIPKNLIYDNMESSAITMFKHNDKLSIFTDGVMFDLCYRIDENKPLESIMKSFITSNLETSIDYYDGYNGVDAFIENFDLLSLANENGEKEYKYDFSYGRFWHGYLFFLRPLLTVFDYSQICILCGIVFLLVFLLFQSLVYKNLGKRIALLMILALASIGYHTMWYDLSVVLTVLVMMFACIYIIKRYDKIKNFYLLFFIIGSITNFVSWMSFTPITFGFPVIFYYLLKKDNDFSIKTFIKLAVIYLLGFGLTWVSKWVLADILYDSGIVKNAIERVVYRNSNGLNGMKLNFFWVIFSNIIAFPAAFFYVILIIYYSRKIIVKLGKKKFIKLLKMKDNLVYLLISFIPFITYLITPNHSYIHAFIFTNKLLMLTGVSILIILFNILNNEFKFETDV